MEVQNSSSFTTAITFLITVLSLLFFLKLIRRKLCPKNNSSSSSQKLPPGPRKLPIIGNIHNLVGGKLPHQTLRDLSRKYGPLMHLKLGEVSTLVVSSPNMAREFMKTHDICFAQRPQLLAVTVGNNNETFTDITFAPYGEYWKQMRKVCVLELLSSKRIQSFAFIREDEARSLVKAIRSASLSSSLVNLTEMLWLTTSRITCRAAFGSEISSQDTATLMSSIKEGSIIAAGFELADLYPSKKFLHVISPMKAKLEKIAKKSGEVFQRIIDRHKDAKESSGATEDLLDVLLRLHESGSLEIPITIENIKAVLTDMFAGGTDTTSLTLEWAMAEMMKNPRVMEKAQAEIRQLLKGKTTIHEADIKEMSYLKLVIKETLRLHPPLPLIVPRECREPCVIDGYEIPRKTRVFINAWAIARDPEHWDDAESFVPERFMGSSVDYKGTSFEFTPFGGGRRICPGISFGLANVEITLCQLLYHFNWSLPDGMRPEELDMTEKFGSTVGRNCNLSLLAVPFTPIEV